MSKKIKPLNSFNYHIVAYQMVIENFGLKVTEVNSDAIKEKLKIIDLFIKEIKKRYLD